MSVELRAARGDRWQPHGLVHRARSRVRLRPNRIRELILVDEWRAGWHANLEGINRYAAKLAEGSTRSYWYAWKGGPRLHVNRARLNLLRAITRQVRKRSRHRPAGCFGFCTAIRRAKSPAAPASHTRGLRAFSDFPLSGRIDRHTRGNLC